MNFEEGLKQIPATQAAFDSWDWVMPVSHYGEIITNMAADNFYEGGSSLTEAINNLTKVYQIIDKTQIFFYYYPEKAEELQKIIEDLDSYKQKKRALDPSKIKSDVGKYNDNLETARAKYYLKYLRGVCQDYNNTNNNIVKIDYVAVRGPGEVLHDATATKYAKGWVNGRFYPIEQFQCERIIKETRDKIEYDWGIDGFIDSSGWTLFTFFDLDKNEMIAELEKRGYPYKKLERPAESRYNG